ncbi:hypothetical protein Oweho_3467 [Owenweeksia hongkongensis DSM 17368]|uniref:Uncharacterized protein n=1 Tax=Owenweeksia hongkongensis (strain DSM 17368 / CIP 108786 / JCM 12287 / NRRL B-23963 / UST20020801) TaxID=926562 RepID=G8R6F3_OWEHD|nr:hypothetical protein [Owenweeksia hongkongensis]AEV34416.1 hypothetical protein Oweho_3467 [Owenweeksia hongkongensis DSM 17368]
MGKLISNSILILVVISSQLYNSMVTAIYQMSYDYYVQELCENKSTPELHCDGKCFFAKQLSLSENKHNETEPPVLIPSLRLFSPTTYSWVATFVENESAPVFYDNLSLHLSIPYLAAIDHPPQV